MSDHASKALAKASLLEESRTYDARSKHSRVSLTTLYYHNHRWRLREAKTEDQLYLTSLKKKVLEKYLKLIANLENSMQIKCLSTLVFSIAH